MKKSNKYYALCRYIKEDNQEVRVCVDKNLKFINNLLDALVKSGAPRKEFRIVENVARKPFTLQYRLDDFTLDNLDL